MHDAGGFLLEISWSSINKRADSKIRHWKWMQSGNVFLPFISAFIFDLAVLTVSEFHFEFARCNWKLFFYSLHILSALWFEGTETFSLTVCWFFYIYILCVCVRAQVFSSTDWISLYLEVFFEACNMSKVSHVCNRLCICCIVDSAVIVQKWKNNNTCL